MWLFLSLHTHLISNAVCALFAGMWLFLSNFYPSDRLTLPYTIIDLAISLSHVIAAPLAALCLSLAGKGGLQGWQWLFLLEGTPTLLLAVVMCCRLPNSPDEGEEVLLAAAVMIVRRSLRTSPGPNGVAQTYEF